MDARWAGILGIEDFAGCEVVIRFDVLRRLPAEFADGRLGVMNTIEDGCAGETGIAFVLSISEINYGCTGITGEFGVREGSPCC